MRPSIAVLAVLALLSACKKPDAPSGPKGFAGSAPPAAEAAGALKGKVLERIDAPPYSYLKLATASGETWAAVTQTDTAVGTEVSVSGFPMKDFESKTLNRKFEVVYFGTLGGGAGGGPSGPAMGGGQPPPGMGAGQPPPGMGAGQPPPGMGAAPGEMPAVPGAVAAQHQAAAAGPTDVKIAKVTKAGGPDGRNVEEIWKQKDALKEKSVTLRGQVVKLTPGVMGRNWLHLRDGSGSTDKKTNDITVTTQDEVKVGDVVTVKGTVRLDKDFGAGYAYPVIVEEAKVSR